jgi:hypothetical protein
VGRGLPAHSGVLFRGSGGIVKTGRIDRVRAWGVASEAAGFGDEPEPGVFRMSLMTEDAVDAGNGTMSGEMTVPALIKALSVGLVAAADDCPAP